MNHCGHRFAAGTRLRLAVSTAIGRCLALARGGDGDGCDGPRAPRPCPKRPARAEDGALAPLRSTGSLAQAAQDQIEPGWEIGRSPRNRNTGEVVWDLSDSDGTNRIRGIDLTFRDPARTAAHDPSRRSDDGQVELAWHRAYSAGIGASPRPCKIVMT